MLVESASRDFPSSETDFRGKLYVVRGYRSGSTGDSGSLGDTANISQSLELDQVIVSTGKIGTGFIRLNVILMIQPHHIWILLKELVVEFVRLKKTN